jgi:hypothetical protein
MEEVSVRTYFPAAFLLCAVTFWTNPAAGQKPPDYATRDLSVILETLGITDTDRQQILHELLADYDASYRHLASTLKADLAAIHTDTIGIQRVVQGLARTEIFLHQRASLTTILETNIEVVLAEVELADWSRLIGDLRRQRLLPQSRLIAENLNVAQLVSDQLPNLSGLRSQEIEELVGEWKADVDAAILRREPLTISGNVLYRRLINEERYREAYDVMTALLDARADLREINLTAASAIGGLLSTEQAIEWRQSVRTAMGQPPLNHRVAAAWRRLETHSECRDEASLHPAESLKMFEMDTLGLADELLAIRIQTEEFVIRSPMAHRVGIQMDRSSLDNAYIGLLHRVRTAETSALHRACAMLGQECCRLFLGDKPLTWPRPETPPEMIDPGAGMPDPPSPHGDPPTDSEEPLPDADSPDEDLPDPMPPTPAQPDTPPPGMEPPEGPDPPDPFGPPVPQAKRSLQQHPGVYRT